MALVWILAQPFTTAALIGATSMEHLKTNIAAADVRLSPEALTDIAATLRDHPMPY
jgi:aryl-alcohol dehydrogenase-like predicted oxidoreductase